MLNEKNELKNRNLHINCTIDAPKCQNVTLDVTLYKSLGLKDKLPQMSDSEALKLLSTDGMLVKRPLLISDDFVLVGFKEAEWADKI